MCLGYGSLDDGGPPSSGLFPARRNQHGQFVSSITHTLLCLGGSFAPGHGCRVAGEVGRSNDANHEFSERNRAPG
jgi:hypothetical protein